MEINTVIAVSTMDKYCACIPFFIQSWKHLFPEVKVIVLLISSAIPKSLIPYKDNIVLITRDILPGHIAVEDIARQLRFFYPSYYHTLSERYKAGKTDTILVSNIDTIPCSKQSFLDALSTYSETTFIQMLDVPDPILDTRFPIKYCIGRSELWNQIFKVDTWNDIIVHMKPMDSLEYFRNLIISSSLYPSNVRIAGNGNINYSSLTNVSLIKENPSDISYFTDYVIPMPVTNYYDSTNLVLKAILSS